MSKPSESNVPAGPTDITERPRPVLETPGTTRPERTAVIDKQAPPPRTPAPAVDEPANGRPSPGRGS